MQNVYWNFGIHVIYLFIYFLNIYYPTIHSYELHNYLNSDGTFFPLSVKK